MSNHPLFLNIGSGKDWLHDALNLDINALYDPDIIFDLNTSLPKDGLLLPSARFGDVKLIDNTFDSIRANDVLEHIANLTAAMETCLRLLKVGGVFSIIVPYDLSYGAWQDPTHVRAFNERSWLYYTDWSWYLGWDDHRFDMKSLKFNVSTHGQDLIKSGVSQDVLLRTPRAIDSMYVELSKRLLTPAEISTHKRLRSPRGRGI